MAVYTPVSMDFVAAMASVHPRVIPPVGTEHLAPPTVRDLEPVPQGSINTTYRVRLSDERLFYLRINENKPFSALTCERDLLDAMDGRAPGLHPAGVVVDDDVVLPEMERSVAGGAFFAVEHAGQTRWATFFAELPGRDLGVFEVTPAHTLQLGHFLGHAHRQLRHLRRRRNPYAIEVVDTWLHGLLDHERTRPVAAELQRAMADVHRRRRPLPRGTIHGDLFIDNTKWSTSWPATHGAPALEDAPRLRAVFDWEMAGTDFLALDLAITICAWCFHRDGEEVRFDDDVAAAFVDGYQRQRRLRPSERRGLFTELRLAAARFTASRLRDFWVPRAGPEPDRRQLDPLDFLARLRFFDGAGERGVLQRLGLS